MNEQDYIILPFFQHRVSEEKTDGGWRTMKEHRFSPFPFTAAKVWPCQNVAAGRGADCCVTLVRAVQDQWQLLWVSLSRPKGLHMIIYSSQHNKAAFKLFILTVIESTLIEIQFMLIICSCCTKSLNYFPTRQTNDKLMTSNRVGGFHFFLWYTNAQCLHHSLRVRWIQTQHMILSYSQCLHANLIWSAVGKSMDIISKLWHQMIYCVFVFYRCITMWYKCCETS